MQRTLKKAAKIRLGYLKPLIDEILKDGIATHYRTFRIPKRGKKGFRTICAPNEKLKYIQREIANQFNKNEQWFRNQAATGFDPGASIKLNALKQHGVPISKGSCDISKMQYSSFSLGADNHKSMATIKMDLANAFDSIGINLLNDSWPRLLDISDIDKETILNICTLNGTLPQGAPTSPLLLNIALAKFDNECIYKINKLWADEQAEYFFSTNVRGPYHTMPIYTRYADDITVSFDKRSIRHYWIHNIVKKVCAKYGLNLKESKTRFMTIAHGRFVTGINIVNCNHISIPRKQRQNIRATIFQASKETDLTKLQKLKESIFGRIVHTFNINAQHGLNLLKYAIELKVFPKDKKISGMTYEELGRLSPLRPVLKL